MEVTVNINGAERTADVEPRHLLVHLIREDFALTGTHIGCDTTSCGACTVLLDGVPVKSCTVFGVQAVSAFSSGVLVNTEGWRTLNYVALPLVILAGLAIAWLALGIRRPKTASGAS